jgi:hypothetical protein
MALILTWGMRLRTLHTSLKETATTHEGWGFTLSFDIREEKNAQNSQPYFTCPRLFQLNGHAASGMLLRPQAESRCEQSKMHGEGGTIKPVQSVESP